MKTNGQIPIDREKIARESTYHAARFGWYDTSQEAQKNNLLTVSVFDMASLEPLPAGTTHKFFIQIDATAYMVTRYPSNRYEVIAHDQGERHRRERELRLAVLDHALWYMTGEGKGYRPGQGEEARNATIKALLGDTPEEEREEGDTSYPVIRDELPDIYLAPASADSPAGQIERQWSVQIGSVLNYCEVGLIGYNPDGKPELAVAQNWPGTEEL